MNKLKYRINETILMNNGLKATIIEYYGATNLDIQFENGAIAKNASYQNFKSGKVACPMIYDIIDNYVKCINSNTKPQTEFLIDLEDLEKIKTSWWNYGTIHNGKIYVKNKDCVYVHRFVMNAKKGEQIDHINGNTLDNRKRNLRFCTNSQNASNKEKQINNTSGYKGVCYDKAKNKWKAQIAKHNKNYFIGLFDNKEQAAIAYNKKAIELHGEFARLNII